MTSVNTNQGTYTQTTTNSLDSLPKVAIDPHAANYMYFQAKERQIDKSYRLNDDIHAPAQPPACPCY
jgi:hypothetical protein